MVYAVREWGVALTIAMKVVACPRPSGRVVRDIAVITAPGSGSQSLEGGKQGDRADGRDHPEDEAEFEKPEEAEGQHSQPSRYRRWQERGRCDPRRPRAPERRGRVESESRGSLIGPPSRRGRVGPVGRCTDHAYRKRGADLVLSAYVRVMNGGTPGTCTEGAEAAPGFWLSTLSAAERHAYRFAALRVRSDCRPHQRQDGVSVPVFKSRVATRT